MLAAFVLGMTLTLIGIVIRLLTAIQHRRVGDIVYWSIMVVWTGWILWESLHRRVSTERRHSLPESGLDYRPGGRRRS